MRKVTYLGVFEPNGDGGYGVYFPDIAGCTSFGETLEEAKKNAIEGLCGHFCFMEQDGDEIPEPSKKIMDDELDEGELVFPVTIFPDLMHNEMDNQRVRTSVTIPHWLKQKAENRSVNFSRLLETALMEYLEIPRLSSDSEGG